MTGCLLICCGLPGSGKTTLCRSLASKQKHDHGKKLTYITVEYDKLYPNGGEKSLLYMDTESESTYWKAYRQSIISCIRLLLFCYSNSHDIEQTFIDCLDNIPQELLIKFIKEISGKILEQYVLKDRNSIFQIFRKLITSGVSEKFVLIIDDNMYYKSMRYDYYKLAREFSLGFCQIFVQLPIELAKKRNNLRTEPVPGDVIDKMAAKFEAPDKCEHWQRYSIAMGSEETLLTDTNYVAIHNLAFACISDPEQPQKEDPDLEAERLKSRVLCSKSMLHQIDQILRKLVSVEMKTAAASKEIIRERATKLNRLKKDILSQFESGDVRLSEDLCQHIENACKTDDNPVFLYVKDILEEKMHSL